LVQLLSKRLGGGQLNIASSPRQLTTGDRQIPPLALRTIQMLLSEMLKATLPASQEARLLWLLLKALLKELESLLGATLI